MFVFEGWTVNTTGGDLTISDHILIILFRLLVQLHCDLCWYFYTVHYCVHIKHIDLWIVYIRCWTCLFWFGLVWVCVSLWLVFHCLILDTQNRWRLSYSKLNFRYIYRSTTPNCLKLHRQCDLCITSINAKQRQFTVGDLYRSAIVD